MVTAVTPVFDQSKTPSSLVGVAATDIPLCQLVQKAEDSGVSLQILARTQSCDSSV